MQPVSGLEMELELFGSSLLLGAGLLVIYDAIRILRRIFPHGVIWISLEDFVYWTAASIFFFLRLCKVNNGIVRGYILLAMALGALIYYRLLSRFLMGWLTKMIVLVKKQLKKWHKAATIKRDEWKKSHGAEEKE